MSLALAIGLMGADGVASARAEGPQTPPSDTGTLFGPDDLLWFEVRVGDLQVAESMDAYASRAGVFLPLGQFARVLDLTIGVFPAQGRAEGWVLSRERRLTLDLADGYAMVGDRRIALRPGQVQVYGDEIYLRTDLVEEMLPMRLQADTSAQVLRIEALETLPFQARLERAARIRGLELGERTSAATRIAAPYEAFSPPVFDINAGGQLARDGSDNARRFDLRSAGDLAFGSVQTFVGSNDDGEVSDVRLSWSRKDPDNHALGRFGGTRAGMGDVFNPSMPIGVAGLAGRGIYYTSAPLESLDIATPLNLRGELRLGEEVELYVNEVLQAARVSPDQGRYEFLDVPLTHGLNTVRLVFYDAHGKTREIVRRINFGAGQVEAGKFVVRFGAVQQGRTLVSIGRTAVTPDAGALRLALQADYGVSERLTLTGGLGVHTPTDATQRTVGLLGVRGSLGAAAVQFDTAFDNQGGRGATGGLSTRLFGASVVARHSEYQNGFIDETRQLGASSSLALRRATDVRADWQVRLPGGPALPLSVDARRLERADGVAATQVTGRMAAPFGAYYASTNLTWEANDESPAGAVVYGESDVATLIRTGVQFRGGLAYSLRPDARIDTAYATVDIDLSERQALRFAAVRAVSTGETSLQATSLWRTRAFDVALNGAYETEQREWRIGLQFGVSFGFDPRAGRYRPLRPGAATGGSARIEAFVDDNGDGARQATEAAIPNVTLETPGGAVATDTDGLGFVSGLGDGAVARLRVDTTAVEDPFLVGGPTELEATPRPGHTLVVSYPMRRTAEVQAVARIVRDAGVSRPLAALDVELVSADGRTLHPGRTDHAGVVYFEGVGPGTYSLRLTDQAEALGLELERPLTVTVGSAGGFADAGDLVVRTKAGPR
ncbi:MAG: hypothetical protein EON90_11405 [Brevundimonas sp.]|nr:MAG: hypothetical protein EON90_11405 [Brevundimonas sp.]